MASFPAKIPDKEQLERREGLSYCLGLEFFKIDDGFFFMDQVVVHFVWFRLNFNKVSPKEETKENHETQWKLDQKGKPEVQPASKSFVGLIRVGLFIVADEFESFLSLLMMMDEEIPLRRDKLHW